MRRPPLVDTNVILRFLIATPASVPPKSRGVFPFFGKLEHGETSAEVPALVFLEAFFVLTSFYQVPAPEAAAKLGTIVMFRGVVLEDKPVLQQCFKLLETENLDAVDAWIVAACRLRAMPEVYSYDADLRRQGLHLLTPA